MKLLILGGTEFVGRAVAEDATARGWDVTLFNRGRHRPLPGTSRLQGDRREPGGLAALSHGEWDAVVDTWTGAPSAVRDSARLLTGRVDRHVYVSSRSVYSYPTPAGLPEDGPVVEASQDAGDEAGYAEAKRGGELAALDAFGERALLVRAGLILGPHENVGRLPWWLSRTARGGDVVAPGPYELALQYVDARDLARWANDAVASGLGGAYNLVSPRGHATMGEVLDTCVDLTGNRARLRWFDPEAVLSAGIEPWTELPIWLPPGELYDALHDGDVSKALATGLRCRPFAETAADTWAWLRSRDGGAPTPPGRPGVGLPREKEAKLLRA